MLSCIKARTSASAEDVYSLEERIVGRWIDGKPVYCVTIVWRVGTNGVDLSKYNIDIIININGMTGPSPDGFRHKLSSYTNTSRGQYGLYLIGDTLYYEALMAGMTNTPFFATIKYTKTTDQPTIPLLEAETNALQEDWSGVAEDEIFREEV